MVRRCKIIATLGPATDDEAVLRRLFEAGVDLVRLNFSHGSDEDHRRRAEQVRRVSQAMGLDIAVLGDLQGPKIRIERFRDGPAELCEGSGFVLDAGMESDAGTTEGVGLGYKQLPGDVSPGDVLLLDDGHIELEVDRVEGARIHTLVRTGGTLADNKGINLRGGGLSAKSLTEKDLRDLRTAASLHVDYLAVSFPRDAEDILRAKQLLREAGGSGLVVAKIERSEAIDNIEAMVDAADVIMVARGDLGVEVGYSSVPGLQKRILSLTRQKNRLAIVATQMMESMVNSSIPTRAEVSDVANAVLDGADAVMLSAETAVGKYPVETVLATGEACLGAERHLSTGGFLTQRRRDRFDRTDHAIATAVMFTANHLSVKAIVALTESGSTALWMSRVRSDIPIFACTRHAATRRRVKLFRGVYPVAFDVVHTEPTAIYHSVFAKLHTLSAVEDGDLLIITKGDMKGVSGGTNAMKILTVRL